MAKKKAEENLLVEEVEATEEVLEEPKKRNYKVKKKLDPNMLIPVRNGFHGPLVYISKKTREEYFWSEFGDEQEIELAELKNARSSSKKFFENNWFMIDDPEVLEYLGVTPMYKYALRIDSFDDLFSKTPKGIEETIAKLSKGQRRSVAYRAKQLIEDEEIDSLKVIETLEKALGIELIER